MVDAKLALNGGELWSPTEVEIERWALAYPGVNVAQELQKMAAWTHDNKPKRPTIKGVARFVGAWLAREQDKSSKVQAFAKPVAKPDAKVQPAASISGDLYRHATALDRIIEEKLGGPAADLDGTFKFDLRACADRVIAACRKELGIDDATVTYSLRSRAFGTARVCLLKAWDMRQ